MGLYGPRQGTRQTLHSANPTGTSHPICCFVRSSVKHGSRMRLLSSMSVAYLRSSRSPTCAPQQRHQATALEHTTAQHSTVRCRARVHPPTHSGSWKRRVSSAHRASPVKRLCILHVLILHRTDLRHDISSPRRQAFLPVMTETETRVGMVIRRNTDARTNARHRTRRATCLTLAPARA